MNFIDHIEDPELIPNYTEYTPLSSCQKILAREKKDQKQDWNFHF